MKVAVIGAGPSGLVTLKYLVEAHKSLGTVPIEARLFESEAEVGGVFFARTYEDAELVSSKQLTTFSDFRPSSASSDFLSAPRYVQYLRDYCTHFDLWPYINCQTTIHSVSRTAVGGHTITYQHEGSKDMMTWECDAVAVCSGLHSTPNVPKYPGIDKVPTVFHSSEFKSREQFGVGKTVLVLGSGETGADVAYLAVTSPTKRVIMSHRHGVHFAPKRNLNPAILPILGRKAPQILSPPLDNARASLFDTAYVHPLLRKYDAPLWDAYDRYVRSVLWLTTGTPHGTDQWVGAVSAERGHVSKIFLNKSNKVVTYISNPYRKEGDTLVQKIRRSLIQNPLPDTHGRQVDLAPMPEFFDENGVVHWVNNSRPEYDRMKNEKIKPDIVVYCTGYKQEFHFFKNLQDARRPYSTAHDVDVRNIWKRDDPSVGFIGFVRPALGAIPPLSEMQAQLWVLNLVAPHRIPRPLRASVEPHYRLHHVKGSRIQYGVDHESYVYQLALDMDSALGIKEALFLGLTHDWRIPVAWALSANLNAKFRMRGPWRCDSAEEVLVDEIWSDICRRRLFWDHFLLSVLPIMIFGPLNLLAYICAPLVECFLGKRLAADFEQ